MDARTCLFKLRIKSLNLINPIYYRLISVFRKLSSEFIINLIIIHKCEELYNNFSDF
jgi:hypothetical protein